MDRNTTGIIILSTILILVIGFHVYRGMTESEIRKIHAQQNKHHQTMWDTRLPPPEWSSPSKCYSCENQMTNQQKYLAEPSKCYSCERQTARTLGSHLAIREQTTKCFDC
jgi:hypothetical protein